MSQPRVNDLFRGMAGEIAKTRFEFAIRKIGGGKDFMFERKKRLMIFHLSYCNGSLQFGPVASYDLTNAAPRIWVPLVELFAAKKIKTSSKKIDKLVLRVFKRKGIPLKAVSNKKNSQICLGNRWDVPVERFS